MDANPNKGLVVQSENVQNDLGNSSQISSHLAYQCNLSSKSSYLHHFKEELLQSYIKIYDAKIENGLEIRMATKIKFESERIYFLLKSGRLILSSSETGLRELFQEPTLDYELEKTLCLIYNVFEDAELEWNQIYDQFDVKRFLAKFLFAQAPKFEDPRMKKILAFEFTAETEANPVLKRLIHVLFNTLILTNLHYTYSGEVERLSKKLPGLLRKQAEIERQEIDFRLKLSKVTNLIESVKIRQQLIQEEIEARESESELKSHLMKTLQDTGDIEPDFIPDFEISYTLLTGKEIQNWALENIPASVKVSLQFKPECELTDFSGFSLSNYLMGAKQQSEVIDSEKAKKQVLFSDNLAQFCGKHVDDKDFVSDDEDEEKNDETPGSEDVLNKKYKLGQLNNYSDRRHEHSKDFKDDHSEHADQNALLSKTDIKETRFKQEFDFACGFDKEEPEYVIDQQDNKLAKFNSMKNDMFVKSQDAPINNRLKRRATGHSAKMFDIHAYLRIKKSKPNLLMKALYTKNSETTKFPKTSINGPGFAQNYISNKVNFDTFQNTHNMLEIKEPSIERPIGLDDNQQGSLSPLEPSDDPQMFDFINKSYHPQNVNYNDFQIMTNSHFLSDNKNNNSSIMEDDFLRQIDEEIKKYQQADFLKSSVAKDISDRNMSKQSSISPSDPHARKKLNQQGTSLQYTKSESGSNMSMLAKQLNVPSVENNKMFSLTEDQHVKDFETIDFTRQETDLTVSQVVKKLISGLDNTKTYRNSEESSKSGSQKSKGALKNGGLGSAKMIDSPERQGDKVKSLFSKTKNEASLKSLQTKQKVTFELGTFEFKIAQQTFNRKVREIATLSLRNPLSAKVGTGHQSTQKSARNINLSKPKSICFVPTKRIQDNQLSSKSFATRTHPQIHSINSIISFNKTTVCNEVAVQTDINSRSPKNSFTDLTTVPDSYSPTFIRGSQENNHFSSHFQQVSLSHQFNTSSRGSDSLKQSLLPTTQSSCPSTEIPSKSPYRAIIFQNAIYPTQQIPQLYKPQAKSSVSVNKSNGNIFSKTTPFKSSEVDKLQAVQVDAEQRISGFTRPASRSKPENSLQFKDRLDAEHRSTLK